MGLGKYVFRSPFIVEVLWKFQNSFARGGANLQMKRLRKFLRMCPNWIRGHERLGYLALDTVEKAERTTANRLIATAQLSAEAIEVLGGVDGSGAASHEASSKIITSGVLFYRQSFAEALQLSEAVLAENQNSLDTCLRCRLFEQAGASALAIGLKDKSRFYFDAIPEHLRSEQATSTLQHLHRSVEE